MRSPLVLALLALPILHAAASLDEFLANYTLPGETVSMQALASSAGSYSLALINSRESLLVNNSLPGSPSLVETALSIESILREDLLLSLPLSSSASEASSSLDRFNASGAGWQALCSQWTGTDRFSCTSLSSCQLACLSVPLCKNVMMGIGDQFALSIWGWRNETSRLESSLSQARSTLNQLPSSEEPRVPLSEALSSLSNARAAFYSMRSNDLFNCNASYSRSYCFCNITFNEAYLNEADEKLASLEEGLSALDGLSSRAAAIAGETAARIRLALQRGEEARFNQTLATAEARLSEAEANASAALALITDENLTRAIGSARSKLSQMRSAGSAKDFERGNALAGELFSLASEIENESAALASAYRSLQDASANASSEIALARSALLPSDGPLSLQLDNLSGSLNASLPLLSPPIPGSQLPILFSEFNRISREAGSIRAKALEKHALEEKALSLQLRLSNLSSLASSYNQRLNSTRFSTLLSEASLHLSRIELAEANASLSSAEEELASLGSSLRQRIAMIEEAEAAIADAEEAIENASHVRVLLFLTPSLEEARAKLDSSRAILYDEPVIARELADLARAKADAEAERVRGICPLAYALALFLLLAVNNNCGERERD